MSSHFSYFNKNNTIIYNSDTNTGRNPVTELFFGSSGINPINFSRFIFNIDTTALLSKIQSGVISTGCSSDIKHYLRMRNTSSFDEKLLNEKTSSGKRRATSFDLVLFRIPSNQNWDEGVGYDYINYDSSANPIGNDDKSFSQRPSNWNYATNISGWTTPGLYDNKNQSTGSSINFSALTIVDTQHFEFGNEDIEFDMTNEINGIISGSTTGVTGWGIAYYPQLENLANLSESYSVGFFTRHTQTFYEPYLETVYDDLVDDDRDFFTTYKINKLYLSFYQNGDYVNLDYNPIVDLRNSNGDLIPNCTGLTTCKITKGVYKVEIPNQLTGFTTPCVIYDYWRNIYLNGIEMPNIEKQIIVQPYDRMLTTSDDVSATRYSFVINGIMQNEKIINTDVRRVSLEIKKLYNKYPLLDKLKIYYRIFVKEGTTQVIVKDWGRLNSTSNNNYYFNFDTRDKIPNEYHLDIMIDNCGSSVVYNKQLTFQIVNQK